MLGTLGDAQLNANSVGSNEVFPNSLTASDIDETNLAFTAGADITGNLGNAPDRGGCGGQRGDRYRLDRRCRRRTQCDPGTGIVNLNETVAAGACSSAANTAGLTNGNAPIGSTTYVFSARPNGSAANAGWVPEGQTTTVVNTGRVRMCNATGASGDPPDMVFDFFTLAPWA